MRAQAGAEQQHELLSISATESVVKSKGIAGAMPELGLSRHRRKPLIRESWPRRAGMIPQAWIFVQQNVLSGKSPLESNALRGRLPVVVKCYANSDNAPEGNQFFHHLPDIRCDVLA